MNETKFYAFIDASCSGKLRVNVEDSAVCNANDMIAEGRVAYGTSEYWQAAYDTASFIIDDPKAYYPELFA